MNTDLMNWLEGAPLDGTISQKIKDMIRRDEVFDELLAACKQLSSAVEMWGRRVSDDSSPHATRLMWQWRKLP